MDESPRVESGTSPEAPREPTPNELVVQYLKRQWGEDQRRRERLQKDYDTIDEVWRTFLAKRPEPGVDNPAFDEWAEPKRTELNRLVFRLERTASAREPELQRMLWATRDYLIPLLQDPSVPEAAAKFTEHMAGAAAGLSGPTTAIPESLLDEDITAEEFIARYQAWQAEQASKAERRIEECYRDYFTLVDAWETYLVKRPAPGADAPAYRDWAAARVEALAPIVRRLEESASARHPALQRMLWASRDYLLPLLADPDDLDAALKFVQHMDAAAEYVARELDEPVRRPSRPTASGS